MKPDIKIIANLLEIEQPRIAILENGKLTEIFIENNFSGESSRGFLQGDIFKARVESIIPAINAAFVKISSLKSKETFNPRNAYLYLNENPDLQNLKCGNELIVQVIKNARKNKAPRVTTKISIPGRWLVLTPNNNEIGVSKKISDNAERKRLKILAEELKTKLSDCGIIIRTAAESISEEFLRTDFESLLTLWNEIKIKAKNNPAPYLLYHETGILGKVLRDEISGSVDEIIIDEENEFERAKNFVDRFFPEKPNIQFYKEITPIFEYFDIEKELYRALSRKIWLRSGAYLVIDQTEALTVIDVNSGKFTTAPDMRHTTLSTNLEAAEEISRQLRLRSIGGIIVVDFIDMEEYQDKQELLRNFEKFLNRDRLKPKIFSITKLGLVELTRKRDRPDLKSILTRNCPVCGDDGFIEREENIAMSIKRFIRKITTANNSEGFLIQTSPHMANYVKNYLSDWEKELCLDKKGKKIFIVPVPDFSWGKFRLEYQGDTKSLFDKLNNNPT